MSEYYWVGEDMKFVCSGRPYDGDEWTGHFKVVRKSAYDTLAQENEKLKEALAIAQKDYAVADAERDTLISNVQKFKTQLAEALKILNKVALYGAGPDAYTSSFTNNVLSWVRRFLDTQAEGGKE